MKFQAFHVNPGEKLKKKDVNNDLSHFMSVFPNNHTHQFLSESILFFKLTSYYVNLAPGIGDLCTAIVCLLNSNLHIFGSGTSLFWQYRKKNM